ncbi:chemotaxis protein CheD [Pseudomonas mangiferae]|uniref:Chemotaxis protein CheD n=1 Tax=Pseudomonas mangiferae TaxID=2593654 RepID=A0A553GWM5_9PSED|nr:chemotaxis protein CheD [Pseudomonas mangiferae]TRX73917.1 chemotaxis protein CheD [Pseudomonas mangiferae]
MSKRFLRPGEYFFGLHQGTVGTLLGSCVSITLWHPRRRLMAVTHFLLPRDPQGILVYDTRYGVGVFHRLLRDMAKFDTHPAEYRKGIFGGGSLMARERPSTRVGQQNIAFAREQFEILTWTADHTDVDGSDYRRLSMDGRTGEVDCQRLVWKSSTFVGRNE